MKTAYIKSTALFCALCMFAALPAMGVGKKKKTGIAAAPVAQRLTCKELLAHYKNITGMEQANKVFGNVSNETYFASCLKTFRPFIPKLYETQKLILSLEKMDLEKICKKCMNNNDGNWCEDFKCLHAREVASFQVYYDMVQRIQNCSNSKLVDVYRPITNTYAVKFYLETTSQIVKNLMIEACGLNLPEEVTKAVGSDYKNRAVSERKGKAPKGEEQMIADKPSHGTSGQAKD
ncbi:MAG: hypothetical protein A2583_05695 [Bdellovibrionales bacterium RIFOXYD1_FULL_53_11]|nr:MAG: hypothetical protein A2583_05695 [Bdellovibrionales bacterium RIFOXYD1_FULL_53_11]